MAPSTDFKRLKAKVGKRAPKAANVTDTSFSSASVQVRSQSISHHHDDSSSSSKKKKKKVVVEELTSSRGLPLQKLLQMLRHPSPIVRCSGLKGIQDAISIPSSSSSRQEEEEEEEEEEEKREAVKLHLSILIPNIIKCIVDEDDDVRSACLSSLRTLLFDTLKTSSSSSSSSSSRRRRNKVLLLRPFLPLLIAYISSSLNSLDQDTKVNGAEAILLLCNFFGSEFLNLNDDGYYYVEELLPPYIALLPQSLSLKHKMTRKEKREKRKRRSKQQKEKQEEEEEEEEEGGVILQSFVALLSTMHSSSSSSVYSNNTFFETNTNDASSLRRSNDEESYVPLLQPADLQFVQGNVASNALLLYPSSSSSSSLLSTNCSNIRNLPPIFRLQENSNSSMIPSSSTKQQQQQNTNCSSSLKNNAQQAIPLLLTKLRDLYVEVTQDKSNHSSSSNGCCLFVHRSNLPTMKLILRGIQLLWTFYCHPLLIPLEEGKDVVGGGGGGGVQDSSQALVLKMGKNVHSLLLQSFPVRNEHSVGIGGAGNSSRKRRSRKEEDVVVQTQQEKEEEEMYEVVNGLFCSILSEMGNTLFTTFSSSSSSFSQKTTTTTTTKRKNVHGAQGTTDSGSTTSSSTTTWVEKVFAYVLPRLDSSSSSLSNDDDDDDGSGSSGGGTTINANVTILKVISQLLLLQPQPQQQNNNQRRYLLKHFQDRKMLLIKFGQAFFGLKKRKEKESKLLLFESSPPPSLQTCMSPSGKYAVLLLCKLIVQEFTFFHCNGIDDDDDDDTTLQTFDNKKKKEEEEEKDQKNSKEKNNHDVTTTILMQMMYALPTYLQHWGNNNNNTTTTVNNVEEMTIILGILLSVVRRIKVEKQSNNNNNNKKEEECQALVQALRLSIGVLFQSDTKKKKKRKKKKKKKNSKRKRSNNNNNNNNDDDDDEYEDAKDDTTTTTVTTTPITHSSIFEKLPSHTQKLAVSLLGMMSYPTEDVVKSCARVCARCAIHYNSSSTTDAVVVVSNEMADYIMQTMYDMRKSMHMSLYLSFVIECVGIGGLDDIVVDDDDDDDDNDNVEKKQQQKEEEEEQKHLQKKQKLGHADGDKSPPNVENDTREEKRSISTVSSIASPVTIDATRLFQRDLAIVRTCNYISRCCRIGSSSNNNNNTNNNASKKILSTLGPILTSWFTATEDENSDDDTLISGKSNKNDVMGSTMKRRRRRRRTTTRYLSRVRAATSILSSIAIDGQQQSLSSSSFCVLEILPNMEDLLRNVIQNTFLGNVRIVANSDGGAGAGKGSTAKENAVQNEMYVRFLSPLVALLSSQTQIVDMFLDQAHRLICSNDDNEAKAKEEKKQWKTNSDNNRDKAILRVFLLLLKHPTLSAVWRDVHISKHLVNIAESIECAVANGPLDRVGGELRTEVNMLVVGCR